MKRFKLMALGAFASIGIIAQAAEAEYQVVKPPRQQGIVWQGIEEQGPGEQGPFGESAAFQSVAPLSVTSPVQLSSPVSGAVQFGSSVGVWSDDEYDYVVVGAPNAINALGGTGRVWVYSKTTAATSFGVPVELVQPYQDGRYGGNDFGRSVAIVNGKIVIGAPGAVHGDYVGLLYVYSQSTAYAGGPPVPGSGFHLSYSLGTVPGGPDTVGYQPNLNVVYGCGDKCRFMGLGSFYIDGYISVESVTANGFIASFSERSFSPWAIVGNGGVDLHSWEATYPYPGGSSMST
jgi:hypothetical protein